MLCYSGASLSKQCGHLFLCEPNSLPLYPYIYLYSTIFTLIKYDFFFLRFHIYQLVFYFSNNLLYIRPQLINTYDGLRYFGVELLNIYHLTGVLRFYIRTNG